MQEPQEINFAALDLGSNSFRLLAVSGLGARWPPARILLDTCYQTRLGEQLTAGHGLSDAARQRGLTACRALARQLQELPTMPVRAYGTEALRQAANRLKFIREAAEILQCEIEVISPQQEAAFTLMGCLAGQKESSRPLLLVDAGGGSTEIILARAGRKPLIRSLPVGAVNLTERFFGAGISPSAQAQIKNFLLELIRPVLTELITADLGKIRLAASGGTANALAMLSLNLESYQAKLVQGSKLTMAGLNEIFIRLTALESRAFRSVPGLGERGAIIPAGIILLQTIIKITGLDLTVSTSGFLEGIVLQHGRG